MAVIAEKNAPTAVVTVPITFMAASPAPDRLAIGLVAVFAKPSTPLLMPVTDFTVFVVVEAVTSVRPDEALEGLAVDADELLGLAVLVDGDELGAEELAEELGAALTALGMTVGEGGPSMLETAELDARS
jgi:hypothetical protein